MEQQFKYFAFISYSSKDVEWGKKLQRKLEHYRMPATLCSEHGWKRKPINPVFFAPTDIQPGGLTEELQDRLQASRNLIVICSPNSAKSDWVGEEIKFYHQLGRTKHIQFFIVDGQPHSDNPDTECFNPIIDTLGLPEILGANIHEKIHHWPWMNKERAYVQLISRLLGVEFDSIWQRHKRQIIQKTIGWITGALLVLAALIGVGIANQPVNVEMRLNEATMHNEELPPLRDAIITMTLANETKTDTIRSFDSSATFTNIPHNFLNKNVRVKIECQNYLTVDTIIPLKRLVCIDLYRDPSVFGNIYFRLWDPKACKASANTEVSIDGHPAKSDANGYVSLTIPLPHQRTKYALSSTIELVDKFIVLPCGPYDVIRFKEK